MNEDNLINCWDIIDEEVTDLLKEFKNLMSDEKNVEKATDYLFNSLLDESILGVVFEVHHAEKTGLYEAIKGVPEDDKDFIMLDASDNDIFGIDHNNKLGKCTTTCPNCNRQVAAARFAQHLEKCMSKCLFIFNFYIYFITIFRTKIYLPCKNLFSIIL